LRENEKGKKVKQEKKEAGLIANGVLGLIVLHIGALNKIGVVCSILLEVFIQWYLLSQMNRLCSNNYGK